MRKRNRMADKVLRSIVIIAVCAMLSAMSFVLMLLEFPVTPPAMGHLKMDFSDIPALFAGIIFGFVGDGLITKDLYVGLSLKVVEIMLVGYSLWRPFSKNVFKRDKENRAVISFFFCS